MIVDLDPEEIDLCVYLLEDGIEELRQIVKNGNAEFYSRHGESGEKAVNAAITDYVKVKTRLTALLQRTV